MVQALWHKLSHYDGKRHVLINSTCMEETLCMRNKKLKESAAGGSVSAHSIAVRTDAGGRHEHPIKRRHDSLLNFMTKFNDKVANRVQMKPVKKPFNIAINEDVSLDQIYSKLSGIENSARRQDDNAVTYGVEDDQGNIMKITVRADQGEEFEVALAQELGDIEAFKMTGRGGKGRDVSMAEVLFNLKQKFDVIDVEFPEIPSDKVYNADKVSKPEDLSTDSDFDDDLDSDDDLGDLGDEGDDLGDMGDDEGSDDDLGLDDEDSDEDLDIGEDLPDGEEDEESILKGIVRMMAAEAEARKAQYEAEAEKSRALQAEYTAKAAEQEMYKQEDLLKMEEEQKRQKEKEAEAKKLADLARYRLRGGVSEGHSFNGLLSFISEVSDLEDETTLRMQRRNLNDIDDSRERALQQQLLNTKRRIIQRKRNNEQQRQQEEENDQRQDDQDQQRQDQPRRNEPVPDRTPIGGSNL